ncbi:uncharacterized protein LOC109862353 [Pseudomyrmex gracilis]|uniref:uncharacterized protein LOC109862353 n=1 Tax=Pseudomyrmex gracilis TaxID=219809 RepID=UPI000994A138|nr:uncharacterized protein LOC109862353 [Pseudomyrmex gracilis]
MVERFHRQLKAAIKCHQTTTWSEVLPIVLMGIRAAWKEDLQATSAEMVFGEPIRLPGQFLCEQKIDSEPDDYIGNLRKAMRNLQPTVKRHGQNPIFLFKDLAATSHVFIRHDATQTGTLRSPHDGPYKVLNHGEKTFKVKINGRAINISIDRLKPAYILQDEDELSNDTQNEPQQPAPAQRRSSRATKPVVRFQPGLTHNQGGPVAVKKTTTKK